MIKTSIIVAGFAISAFILPVHAEAREGRVTRVLDGDTVDVRMSDGTYRVRLANIDAPEKAQPYGRQSTQLLATFVMNKTVDVRQEDVDRYGRIVGTLTVGGMNVNRQMACQGAAWAYLQYLRDRQVLACQNSAKSSGKGLWASRNAIAPWAWRHSGSSAPSSSSEPRRTTAPRASANVTYKSCAAARAARATPLRRGSPGYSSRMDRDGDGVACE